MLKINRMLLRMIKEQRGQFIAVLIIVMVGIAIYTALSMASVNLDRAKEAYYETSRFADLFIKAEQVPQTAVDRLTKMEGIEKAEGRIVMDVPFVTKDDKERVNVRLVSTKGEEQEINTLVMTEGTPIKNPQTQAVVLKQFAEARNLSPGDEIKVQINGRQYALEVSGIAESPEFIYLMENEQSLMPNPKRFGVIYVSEALARQACSLSGSYNEVVLTYGGKERQVVSKPDQEAKEENLIEDISERLSDYGLRQVIKKKDQLSNNMVSQEIKQLKSVCVALPLLFLAVAALILMMMLSRMVKRDRIKIGVLKAIGYSNGKVMLYYVKYCLIAGILGGILGIALGTFIADYMTGLYIDFFQIPEYEATFYYSYVFFALLLSAGFCCLSGFLGAKGALVVAPAESMQAEAPKTGKRIALEKWQGLWRKFSFSQKMVFKNIFRNKKRSFFVMMGTTLTYGMMLFTMTMPQVVDSIVVKHFEEFQTMDYSINFYRPVEKHAILEFSYMLSDCYAEGKIELPFELSNGHKTKVVPVVGLEKNTEFFSFSDVEGNPVGIPKNGILLTENAARTLDVKTGDRVRVKSFLPSGADIHLPVKGVIKQSLGMNGYMEISAMGEKLFAKNAINGVYLDTRDENVISSLREAENISTIISTVDMQNAYGQFLGLMVLCIGCMVFLSGILGFCIVYNSTIVSLGEREMEFSSLRVMGFGKDEIFRMILLENSLISALGLVLGIPVGFWMAAYSSTVFSTDVYTLNMYPSFSAGVMALALTLGFLFLAQLATYEKINTLDFLQALKNRAS